MPKAQQWLEQNYPENGVCSLTTDTENLGKLRKNITELDISEQNLEGELKLIGFDSLWNLNLDNNQITTLDCSEVFSLTNLSCENNPLKKIKVSNVESEQVSLDITLPGIEIEIKENKKESKIIQLKQKKLEKKTPI